MGAILDMIPCPLGLRLDPSTSLREQIRDAAVRYVEDLRSSGEFFVVPESPALFHAALQLYGARLDKSYSMTDCMSMVVCRERAITDVLTYDRDFEQEGFVAMLRGA